MKELLISIKDIIWGLPLITLLLGTGIYFTYKLRFIQFKRLSLAFRCIFEKEDDIKSQGDVSSFGALCTALSSTIGTGNIVGVATAIMVGGPGAMFWMWFSAFFGMATKYAEGVLTIIYRIKDHNNEFAGGPMYYLQNGLNYKFLAKLFAFFGVLVALLGIGTFSQVKSISDGIYGAFGISSTYSAIITTLLVAFITLGGIKRIAKVSEVIVPFMSFLYIFGVLIVLITNFKVLPSSFVLIFKSAFNPSALGGGFLGLSIMSIMRVGISRGIFSNEAGLGSAPIAAAAAKTKSPIRQGLISMTGTFIDTIVICTFTGLAIIVTNSYLSGVNGANITALAFDSAIHYGIGSLIVNVGLVFFAFTTIIGWNYYGEKCIQYLLGNKAILIYKIIFIICIAIGPFMSLDLIFIIADIVNGLMVFPNLIALIGLRRVVIEETNNYFSLEEEIYNLKHK